MPRTKVKRAVSTAGKQNTAFREYFRNVENYHENQLAALKEIKKNFEDDLDTLTKEERISIPAKLGNKTLAELRAGVSATSTIMGPSIVSLNSTKAVVHKSRQLRRSVSMTEDEGYLTAGSNTSNEKRTRRSRSQQQTTTRTTRLSRSLSRSNVQKTVTTAYKTPANKLPRPQNYGTITPKMKPNTPQLVLRRPKLGEVAVSMQGSPLLVSGMVSDEVPNVNIPLGDGRTISIQPKRGLRPSLLPAFDMDTIKQIATLRDNLNKMCAAAQPRH